MRAFFKGVCYTLLLVVAFMMGSSLDTLAATNNPGNIKIGNDWLGEADTCKSTTFECFDDVSYGVRAVTKILVNYHRLHGINNIHELVHRYAPPHENNTQNYITMLSHMMGIKPTDMIDFDNYNTMRHLVASIIYIESNTRLDSSTLDCGLISGGLRP